MSTQKTARERLQELPDGYRELANENMEKLPVFFHPTGDNGSISEALLHAFEWSETPQPDGWWSAVRDSYAQKGAILPPLPETEAKGCGLPSEATERKAIPIYSGVLKYFPDAINTTQAPNYTGTGVRAGMNLMLSLAT
jgi:hypothetical protein